LSIIKKENKIIVFAEMLIKNTKENNFLRAWPISKKVYTLIVLTFGKMTG